MTKALSNHYFRYLRDLYSVELQIISLIPEICGQIQSDHLGGMIDEARRRRDILELIAADHDISAAGDDSTTMRTLVRQARASLADCDDPSSRNAMAGAACEKVRRHTQSGYKVIALLAEQLDFPVDAARINKLLGNSFSDVAAKPFPVSKASRSSVLELLPA